VKVKVDTSCTVVGIEDVDLAAEEILIYPNPVSRKLNITFSSKQNIDRIQLLDLNGKLVYESAGGVSADGKHQIDVSPLSNGVYFLRIQDQENLITKKVIVNK